MEIPQLTIGKRHDECLHAQMFLGYPTDTPFGNLNLAEMEIFSRIDYLNICIKQAYEIWKQHIHKSGFVPQEMEHLRLRIEDIVYSLRKVVDTVIAISCILGERVSSGKYPDQITVDCIGRLCKQFESETKIPAALEPYRRHITFLTRLNDISNSYKHHFVNHELINIMGSAEPSAFVFPSTYNKAAPNHKLCGVTVSELCNQANHFFKSARENHKLLIHELSL